MQSKISPTIATLIVVAMVSVATVAVAKINNRTTDEPAFSDPTRTPQSGSGVNNKNLTETVYKDGTYTAQGRYSTPGGVESIGLTVTLKNDIIHDVELEQQASGGDTEIYQKKFASGYAPLVKGKNIEDVKLNRVAGSSLTSDGFNKALESIKRDAAS